MKQFLSLLVFSIFVELSDCQAQVQKYILTSGTNGYFTLTVKAPADDGTATDYTRGNVGIIWYISPKGDTQMSLRSNQGTYPSVNINYTVDSNWQNGDATNGNFPTADSLYRWTRRHVQKYVGN